LIFRTLEVVNECLGVNVTVMLASVLTITASAEIDTSSTVPLVGVKVIPVVTSAI